ncbi:hypothetical protein FBUS_02523 [Fasciolopsis buskii]|uniref:Uncharacterized protein n=1 Tax=Fasciolopsis buskii TaxID=27845 RepID=A0A8E0VKA3_9TREM|nr:hypothetical protein FBUS_02523 [Fasciolopsis buski]
MAGFTQILLSNLPFDDIKCHRSRKNKECLTGPPPTAIRDATVEALSSQIPLLMESLKPTKVSKSNDVIKQHLHYNPGGIPHLESCLQSSADDYDEFTGDIAKLYHAARLVLRRDSNADILSAQILPIRPIYRDDTSRGLDLPSNGIYSTDYASFEDYLSL